MTPERLATIDVGTNTVLLLVAERRDGKLVPIVERAEITRLGRGVDASGRLAPEAIAETVRALAAFAAEARALGAERITCVATSAARDAANGPEFFDAVRAAAGLVPAIISGDEEARLVYRSAWRDFGAAGTPALAPGAALAVLDVGGGSTELTWGTGPSPAGRMSLQIGAVRLTERHVRGDPPSAAEVDAVRAAARAAFEALPPDARGLVLRQAQDERGAHPAQDERGAHPAQDERGAHPAQDERRARLVAVAGTVTTLSAVAQRLERWDPDRVHGATLGRAEVEALLARLAALPVAARAALPGMEPKRADVIVAGCAIVLEAMRATGFDALTVSDRGVRWGLLEDAGGAA